jgi:hypothetical protein
MRIHIYSKANKGWKSIMHWIKINQNGVCHLCGKEIAYDDHIVSKAKHRTAYYHQACAELVNIL